MTLSLLIDAASADSQFDKRNVVPLGPLQSQRQRQSVQLKFKRTDEKIYPVLLPGRWPPACAKGASSKSALYSFGSMLNFTRSCKSARNCASRLGASHFRTSLPKTVENDCNGQKQSLIHALQYTTC